MDTSSLDFLWSFSPTIQFSILSVGWIRKTDFHSDTLQSSLGRKGGREVSVCSDTLLPQAVSILVWDQDDPCTVHKVGEAVEEYKSVVRPCSSAAGLLSTLQHKAIDVVILNLQKPLENAFQLLSEIQAKAPQVEVIFVAPFDDDETRWAWTETIHRGAYEFLPKPLDSPELNRVLVQAIERHHPMQLRKRPPAESVRDVTSKARKRATSSGPD